MESKETRQPTFEQMKQFLVKRYKHDRLYGRNAGNGWSADYGDAVVRSHLSELAQHGLGNISRHESATGEAVWYQFANGAEAIQLTH